MIEYIKASKNDKAEIIDFINYVFSNSEKPHDFKKLLPKAYSDEVDGMGAEHYIVREDGKIKGVVANRIIDADYCGNTLKIGLIGSVAVHPYSRGQGFMKNLMKMAIDDAEDMGVQLLLLSGKRQRYGYFGFENAGILYNFKVSDSNIRHALEGVDDYEISFTEMSKENQAEIRLACQMNNLKPCHTARKEDEFLRIMGSWSEKSYIIRKNDEMIGYSFALFRELVLKDEAYYPEVVKAMLKNVGTAYIPAAAYERGKIEFLSSICEDYSISHFEKASVLDWKAVIFTFLDLKSKITELDDGEMTFAVDDVCIRVTVRNNKVSVTDAAFDADTKKLSHNQAEGLIFELDGLINNKLNWFPLPLYLDAADTF